MSAATDMTVNVALHVLSRPRPAATHPRYAMRCGRRGLNEDTKRREQAVKTLVAQGLAKFTLVRLRYNGYDHHMAFRSAERADAAFALLEPEPGDVSADYLLLIDHRRKWLVDFEAEPATTPDIAEEIKLALVDGHDDIEVARVAQVVMQARTAARHGWVVDVESHFPIESLMVFVQRSDAEYAADVLRTSLGSRIKPHQWTVEVRSIRHADLKEATHFFLHMWEWDVFHTLVTKWHMAMDEQDRADEFFDAEDDSDASSLDSAKRTKVDE